MLGAGVRPRPNLPGVRGCAPASSFRPQCGGAARVEGAVRQPRARGSFGKTPLHICSRRFSEPKPQTGEGVTWAEREAAEPQQPRPRARVRTPGGSPRASARLDCHWRGRGGGTEGGGGVGAAPGPGWGGGQPGTGLRGLARQRSEAGAKAGVLAAQPVLSFLPARPSGGVWARAGGPLRTRGRTAQNRFPAPHAAKGRLPVPPPSLCALPSLPPFFRH